MTKCNRKDKPPDPLCDHNWMYWETYEGQSGHYIKDITFDELGFVSEITISPEAKYDEVLGTSCTEIYCDKCDSTMSIDVEVEYDY